MKLSHVRGSICELIDREIELAHELAQALAEENEALRHIDHSALDKATAAKQRCIEALANLDAERNQLCTGVGVTPDRDGMASMLREADDDNGTLVNRWHSLLALLEACREANQRNGVVVTVQRRRVSNALGLLRGEQANALIYDDRGEIGDTETPRVRAEI